MDVSFSRGYIAVCNRALLPGKLEVGFSATRLSSFCVGSLLFIFLFWIMLSGVYGLGSMASIAATYSDTGEVAVCRIMQGARQGVQCWQSKGELVFQLLPDISISGISAGKGFVCGLPEGSLRPLCWAVNDPRNPRRLENNVFSQVVAGDSVVCGLTAGEQGLVHCWRDRMVEKALPSLQTYTFLAAGSTFVCGITSPNKTVECWGQFHAYSMPNTTAFLTVQVGAQHACGITTDFVTYCWGNNSYGQSDVPSGVRFVALALGAHHSCGLLGSNHKVLCWGDNSSGQLSAAGDLSFLAIIAGDRFSCGVVKRNYSSFCWGGGKMFGHGRFLPFNSPTIPSFCTKQACGVDLYAISNNSNVLGGSICGGSDHVCVPCTIGCEKGFYESSRCGLNGDLVCLPIEPSIPPSPSIAPAATVIIMEKYRPGRWLIVAIVVGSVGTVVGVLSMGWCCWIRLGPSWKCTCTCNGGQGRVHHSAQAAAPVATMTPSPSLKIKRQRSSTSSYRRTRSDSTIARAQAFSYMELALATHHFQEENKIGAGSFGSVYRGELSDGREVAIKRGEKEGRATARKMEEKESAFQSELEFLSRVHHKHLVSLVGYCDEGDERMLVYDYMPNGTLYDHLHRKGSDKQPPLSWHMRIKIALEAARGIEYLHTYAVPPIIHRDIKSSNILLDGSWCARVSDFGLSLMGPAEETSHLSLMAAGTVGYMDPEYYRLQHLTTKSDVYSFGVVLLEILTGLRAIQKQVTGPINLVDVAVPRIMADEVLLILDSKPQKPEPIEIEAISVSAEVAEQCVRLEGRERPSMTEIVSRLEHALALSLANQKMQARNFHGGEIHEHL